MTTFDFKPNLQAPVQFQPTFDNATYNVIVTWNLFGQRYYVNIYTLGGDLVVSLPLIGSTDGFQIQSMSWDAGKVSVVLETPHKIKIGSTVKLTIAGVTPDAYNGIIEAFIIDETSFVYNLTSFPGIATVLGTVNDNISMTAGYFNSTLVFREANQQFEVSP